MKNRLAIRRIALHLVAASLCLVAVPSVAQAPKDIVEVAVAAGSFKTLVAAVQAANLVDVLKRPGPLTVLAPTDEAFAKIPKADLDALMKDKAKLATVLQYHVLTGSVTAGDLKMMKDFGTAHGGRIQIAASGATLKINSATVVKADIPASNGIIHVIDTVLMPK